MKQSLQLRLGQQITMTPQLQQAIRLLQLSTLDLQMEIQQALESNMMLEEVSDDDDFDNNVDSADDKTNGETEDFSRTDDSDKNNADEIGDDFETELNNEVSMEGAEQDIPEELAVDTGWDDIYPTEGATTNKDFILQQNSASETLYDYLMWQLDLTPFTDIDRAIATAIIDSIDENGYLRTPLDDIHESLLNEEYELELEEVATVLQRIQHFDPAGVGARDLAECLRLQLDQIELGTHWLEEAKTLVTDYIDLLGGRDYTQLVRRMKLSREELHEVLLLIQTCNPRPGEQFSASTTEYVEPDVFVRKVKGNWQVSLNPEVTPRLRVNTHYANLVSTVNSKAETESLKTHLQEARWFIKSLKSRHETLLRVTTCIMERQSAFLDYGEEAMKPLILHDIATELDMHESTISRVTTQKYVHTPRGIFELKYFFSSHVSTNNGGECSSTAIRALIKKLIAAEDSAKPLSDSKIAKTLSDQGINVARRTVAKYREAMMIPPSNERKHLV